MRVPTPLAAGAHVLRITAMCRAHAELDPGGL